MDIKTRKKLAGQAHQIKPFLVIGDDGLSENHVNAIRRQFESHELIKVRLTADDTESAQELAESICEVVPCELVARTGYIAVLYSKSVDAA